MKANAIYSFTAQSEVELSFDENEQLDIVDRSVGNGWWTARNAQGKCGLIPEAYVDLIEDSNDGNQAISLEEAQSYVDSDLPINDPYTRSWASGTYVDTEPKVTVATSNNKHKSDQEIKAPDSDFDDDLEDTYSTLSEQMSSDSKTLKPKGRIIRAKLFDSTRIENFLLNGSKVSIKESDMAVIQKSSTNQCEWEQRDPNVTRYQISTTTEKSKLAGLKQFTVYYIVPELQDGTQASQGVYRRFKQFDWLHLMLNEKFRLICIPGLPEKFVTGRFEPDLIEARKLQLKLWINRIAQHPVLKSSPAVVTFLSRDVNYNSSLSIKEWKRYKRETENDVLRGSNWFACIKTTSPMTFSEADKKIDSFYMFISQFDKSNLNILNQLVKFTDFSIVSSREYAKFAQIIVELGKTFHNDNYRHDCKNLSTAIISTGKAYSSISKKLAEPAGVQSFLYSLREYSTMLTNFSNVLGIQRNTRDILGDIKTNDQHRIPPDVVKRGTAINSAVLAEITHFDKNKRKDYNNMLKEFVSNQKKQFQEIVNELSEVERSFA
ncbi:hypothetical protein GJ496_009468 [Pomphorhynchus laevis]|nr:hypothetical protein GJ496_009468 [Pomphorhynchus laevis]